MGLPPRSLAKVARCSPRTLGHCPQLGTCKEPEAGCLARGKHLLVCLGGRSGEHPRKNQRCQHRSAFMHQSAGSSSSRFPGASPGALRSCGEEIDVSSRTTNRQLNFQCILICKLTLKLFLKPRALVLVSTSDLAAGASFVAVVARAWSPCLRP